MHLLPLSYLCRIYVSYMNMRGIKVGNILVFRGSAVCIISNIVQENGENIIIGIDSYNHEHRGPAEEWSPVIRFKEKLRQFEEKIFNNIVVHKGTEAR